MFPRSRRYCNESLIGVMTYELPQLSLAIRLSQIPGEDVEELLDHIRENYPEGEIPSPHQKYFKGASQPVKNLYQEFRNQMDLALYSAESLTESPHQSISC
tara:strand:- start:216 stop:518 length:303 start_codon:yes stop_codon:yes gene_type:complete